LWVHCPHNYKNCFLYYEPSGLSKDNKKLADMDKQLFVSKYQLEPPKKEEMQRFLAQKMKKVRCGEIGVVEKMNRRSGVSEKRREGRQGDGAPVKRRILKRDNMPT